MLKFQHMRRTNLTYVLLMTILITSLYVFNMKSWGRYVLLSISIILLFATAVRNGGKIVISNGFWVFCGFVAAFCLFCYVSAAWAWNAGLAISKGTTLLEILICFSILYLASYQNCGIHATLESIVLAGIAVACYTIVFYGFNELSAMAAQGTRAQNEYANVNSIGMLTAMSTMILYYAFLQKKKLILLLLIIPMIPVLIITQSRKAFGMIVIGIFLITAMHDRNKKQTKRLMRILLAIAVSAALIYAVLSIPVFSGVVERFERAVRNYRTGHADERTIFRRIGMIQFKKTPILGIGIGNSPLLSASFGARSVYLHCNYVELLACGGIIGFAVFYSMYVYLFYNFWKFRHVDPETTALCVILLIVLFAKDYALVSYYSKQEYIYFMCLFMQVDILNKKYKSLLKGNDSVLKSKGITSRKRSNKLQWNM